MCVIDASLASESVASPPVRELSHCRVIPNTCSQRSDRFLYSRRDVAANLRRGGAVGVEDLCGYLLESMTRPIMWVRAWIHRDLGPRMGRRREWFHVIPRWIHGSRRTWRGGRNSKTERGIISGQSNTILIWIPEPSILVSLVNSAILLTRWLESAGISWLSFQSKDIFPVPNCHERCICN